MSDQTRAPNEHISPKNKFRIMQRLEASLEKDGEYLKYKDDMTDAKLGAEFNVSESTMRNIRRQVFGHLKRGAGTTPIQHLFEKQSSTDAHIAALEKRIIALEDYITRTGKAAYGSQTAIKHDHKVNSFADLGGALMAKTNG